MYDFNSKDIILVEVPKTGSSTLAKLFSEKLPHVCRNVLHVPQGDDNEKVLNVITHEPLKSILKKLENSNRDPVFVFFVRDPTSVIISKYYFYKKGRAKKEVTTKLSIPKTLGEIKKFLGVMSANIFPLPIWSLLYPFKSTFYFINGYEQLHQDKLLVLDFDKFETSANLLFQRLDLELDEALPVINQSFKPHLNRFQKFILNLITVIKLRRDVFFYRKYINSNGQ